MERARLRWALAGLALGLLACSLGTPTRAPTTAPPTTTAPATPTTPQSTPVLIPTQAAPTPSPPWTPPAHVIGVRSLGNFGEFYDRRSGGPWTPRGVNYVFVPAGNDRYETQLLKVGVYDAARTRADFGQLAGLGYNTVRVFLDHCNQGPGCIGDSDNDGLNPAYLDNMADMLRAAREAGLFILFTSNDLPDQGGYSEQANSQSGGSLAGYRNSYYLAPAAVAATRRYWGDLLTGLRERQAPFDAVFAWELVNEQWMFADQPPLSLTEGLVETFAGTYDMSDPEQKRRMVAEGLVAYITEVKAEILTHDPTALVTMGFFVPDIAAPGWYVDTASLLTTAPLDFFDFHGYPGGASLAEHAEHFGLTGDTAKPILLGEYGAFRFRYADFPAAAQAVTNWVADSCAHDFDGWLYWAYYPANPEVDDRTWSFTDEDGALMQLLAPANQPDPCVPPEIAGLNLAQGKPATASNAQPPEGPEQAVDGNADSIWLSGDFPPQWIEIDLEQPYRLAGVRLLVAQSPAGPTVHRLWVRGEGGAAAVLAHEFSGPTQDNEWLEFVPETPLENVRYLRIETVTSPSWVAWREIQVQAAP